MVRVSDPHGELPIKNHKYVKNCTELYLAQRGIQKLANFDAFVNLEVLWINDNEISALDGLDQCFRIKNLHAHNNCIRSLDDSSLVHFKFLEELRLYGNKLKDLQSTLRVLRCLQHLHDLDLFDNPVAEEEGYRYLVVAAIPSLRVLDRHVVTDEDRERAVRFAQRSQRREKVGSQIDDQFPKASRSNRAAAVPGAPPQKISGTVRLLMKEVSAIKRDQQQRAVEESRRELQELEHTRQQTLVAAAPSANTRSCSGGLRVVPGLDGWETSALEKCFRLLENAKDGGISRGAFEKIERYLRTRGFELRDQQSKVTSLDLLQISEPVKWADFLHLLWRSQVQCKLMVAEQLRHEAERCFIRCQALERRLQSQSHDAVIMAELQQQSQEGYRLQALADCATMSPTQVPVFSRDPTTRASNDGSGARSRFCFTIFAREALSPSTPPDCSFGGKGRAFLDLKTESAGIDEKLCRKYKLRGKDFHKYMAKQDTQPAMALVRRRVDM